MSNKIRVGNLSLMFAMLLACVLYGSVHVSAKTGASDEDEAAIRENVKQMETGWNTGSGTLFAKPFAEDADYVIINGMQIKGREVIGKAHQQIFDTFYKGSTLSLSVKQVRFIRPDVAVVHLAGHLKSRRGEEAHEANATITLVMTKDKGEWKIAAFQNTEVTASRRS